MTAFLLLRASPSTLHLHHRRRPPPLPPTEAPSNEPDLKEHQIDDKDDGVADRHAEDLDIPVEVGSRGQYPRALEAEPEQESVDEGPVYVSPVVVRLESVSVVDLVVIVRVLVVVMVVVVMVVVVMVVVVVVSW